MAVATYTPAGTVEDTLPVWVKLCGRPESVIELVDNDTVGRDPVPLTVETNVNVGKLELKPFWDVTVNVAVGRA